jgi:hypothetical protein
MADGLPAALWWMTQQRRKPHNGNADTQQRDSTQAKTCRREQLCVRAAEARCANCDQDVQVAKDEILSDDR